MEMFICWLSIAINCGSFLIDIVVFFLFGDLNKYFWKKLFGSKTFLQKSARLFCFVYCCFSSIPTFTNRMCICCVNVRLQGRPTTHGMWNQTEVKKKQVPFSAAGVVMFEFGRGKKKKMTSGRLVSLPHLHEKQESIPLSLSSIYSSCQYYLINDPMHYSKTVWTFAFWRNSRVNT